MEYKWKKRAENLEEKYLPSVSQGKVKGQARGIFF